MILGWANEPMIDAYCILVQVVHSKSGTAGVFNWGDWGDRRIDALIDKAGVDSIAEAHRHYQANRCRSPRGHHLPAAASAADGVGHAEQVASVLQLSDNKARHWLHDAVIGGRARGGLRRLTLGRRLRCRPSDPETLNAARVMLTVAFRRLPDLPVPGRSGPADAEPAGEPDPSATSCGAARAEPRLPMQFATFVGNAANGDFGISYRNQKEVFTLIAERFPATFELVLVATFLSLLIGIPLGVYAAIRRNARSPAACTSCRWSASRSPPSSLGILLILVFSVALQLAARLRAGRRGRSRLVETGFLTPPAGPP